VTERTEAGLRAVGEHLDWPPEPDVLPAVRSRLEAERRGTLAGPFPRSVLVAAAALVAVALLVAALPGPRQAVADWLGVTGVRVVLGGDTGPPDDLGRAWSLGRAVSVPAAERAAPFRVRRPERLGWPAEAWVRGSDATTEISFVWPADGGPILLTQFVAPAEGPLFAEKRAADGTTVRQVRVGSGAGLWLEGATHVVTDAGGRRRAGNTLLWEMGGVTFRLESALPEEEALAIAGSVR
jgi:hypothetical protein